MKTSIRIGVAVSSLFAAMAAHGQVLGGNVVGGLGGAVSGGMRDIGVATQGDGSFGADFDTGALRRSSEIVGRSTDRVRGSAQSVRERTGSALRDTRTRTESAAATTASAVNDSVNAATDTAVAASAAGSLASTANVDGARIIGDRADAAAAATPASESGGALEEALSPVADGNNGTASQGGQSLMSPVLQNSVSGNAAGDASASKDGASVTAGGGVDGSMNASVQR